MTTIGKTRKSDLTSGTQTHLYKTESKPSKAKPVHSFKANVVENRIKQIDSLLRDREKRVHFR